MAKKKTKRKQKKQQQSNLMWAGIIVIILLALGGLAFIISGDSSARLPGEITVEEAYKKYEEGAFVLDVRTPEEWDEYHAPNTTLIPLDDLPSRVSEVPTDQEIVVICRSGNRSQAGRDILLEAGYKNVTSTAGGLKAWSAAGYPIEGTRP